MIMAVEVFISLFDELVKSRPRELQYLLGNKAMQDHLEFYFSSVRAFHGNNNNPNVLQFNSAVIHLSLNNEIKG